MTDKPTPTDTELKAMWQLHAADIGGIFYYARAVLAKWGTPAPVEAGPLIPFRHGCKWCGKTTGCKHTQQPAPSGAADEAPLSSLPSWEECQLRVSNSDFLAKRVAEGGYGAESDSKVATELHRFLYEYDDQDPYRSAWFRHRLEKVLTECASHGPAPAQPTAAGCLQHLTTLQEQAGMYADDFTPSPQAAQQAPAGDESKAIAALHYYRDECSGAEPSISVFHRMVDEALAAPAAPSTPASGGETVKFTAAHVSYINRYGGNCRDCADENGVCPTRGLPCGGSDKAIRFVLEALAYGLNNGYVASPTIEGESK